VGQTIVQTSELTKHYDGFTAVDRLNLRIEEGEVFGFLGPNGAGKTTTILMLLGLTEPSSGTAQVCGYDPTREPLKVKRVTGYMPEKVGFYEDLTARQNLRYTAELNALPGDMAEDGITRLLQAVGLSEVADHEVRTFSRGMKQRLGIADVWVKDPKLIFFDEPTTGIDPEGIEDVLELIQGMAGKGITVVFCSHQLHLVQRISNRVGILAKGRLVAEGPIDSLGRQAIGGGKYRIDIQVAQPSPGLVDSIERVDGIRGVEASGESLLVTCDEDLRSQLAKVIVDSGSLLVGMKIEEHSLETIYRKYFGDE